MKELTTEQFNITTHDIRSALSLLRDLSDNVNVLRIIMGDEFKQRLHRQYPNANVDQLNSHNLTKIREVIEARLIGLEPALNSVKQIERLPTVAEIVRMIENNPDKQITLL